MVLVLSDKFKGSYGLIERNRVKKPAGKSALGCKRCLAGPLAGLPIGATMRLLEHPPSMLAVPTAAEESELEEELVRTLTPEP